MFRQRQDLFMGNEQEKTGLASFTTKRKRASKILVIYLWIDYTWTRICGKSSFLANSSRHFPFFAKEKRCETQSSKEGIPSLDKQSQHFSCASISTRTIRSE
nr:hypothetical protein [Marseillevirus cajuinensis]